MIAFKPSDGVTILFSLLFALIALLHIGNNSYIVNLFVLYLSFAFFQYCLILLSSKGKFFIICRDMIFPLVAVFSIFDSLTLLIPVVNPVDLDYMLIRADYYIFGLYPTVFFERFHHPLLSDVLQTLYSLYYFLPFVLGVSLKIKGKNEDFEECLALVLLCFYLSYIGYLIVPALGPRYVMEHLHGIPVMDGLFSGPLRMLLNAIEGIKRDAFPSGHTGVSLLLVILAWRHARFLVVPFSIITAGIIIATVYFRYHYAIDIIAGIILTVVTISTGKVYYLFTKKVTQR